MGKKDNKTLVRSSDLAKLFDITDRRIQQLTSDGVLTPELVKVDGHKIRHYDLFPNVHDYVVYLRNRVKGDAETPEELEIAVRKIKAETELKEAKAEIEAIKRDELIGIMHRSEDVEEVLEALIMTVRAEVLAIPGAVAIDVAEADTAQKAAGIIKNAVNNVLNRLSEYEYDPEVFKKLVRDREQWMNDDNRESEENKSDT